MSDTSDMHISYLSTYEINIYHVEGKKKLNNISHHLSYLVFG